MSSRLFIQGIDVTDDIENFDEFEIEVGLNENKTVTRTLSRTLVATGETFAFLEKQYFKTCNNYNTVLTAVFKSDVCSGITIPLKITFEGLGYFPDAEKIEFLIKSITEEDIAYAKLESSYWFDNDFPTAFEIPIVYYADQPNYIQWIIIVLISQIKIVINAIDTAINAICEVVTLTFGKCKLNLSKAIFSGLDTWLAGVGKWITAPLIREILDYQSNKAGIHFSSSLLKDTTSPYYNMGMLHMDMGIKGSYKDTSRSSREKVLLQNAPLWTVIELLDNLKLVFEGYEYRLIGGVLYFENENFFFALANKQVLNLNSSCDESIRYEYKIEGLFAYGEFKFQTDSFDSEGNKMMGFYSQKLDFNNPYSATQKGKLSRLIPFGPARFMWDPLTYENEGFVEWENMMDNWRDGPETWFQENILTYEGLIRTNDLILTGNMLSIPKLLVFENNFIRSDAKTIKKEYRNYKGKQYWLYNYPLLFKETQDRLHDNKFTTGTPGALTSFAETANPRLQKDILFINSITIDCECTAIDNIIRNFQSIYIQTKKGKGIPENVRIKISENEVEVTYEKVKISCAN